MSDHFKTFLTTLISIWTTFCLSTENHLLFLSILRFYPNPIVLSNEFYVVDLIIPLFIVYYYCVLVLMKDRFNNGIVKNTIKYQC